MMSKVVRFQSMLSGLWAGVLLAIGGIAAPALFSVLERQQAGAGAGQIFHIESRLSLAFAILLFVLERRRVRDEVEQGASQSAMSANLLLVLGALFLTVLGGFALQPMIQAAKAGEPTALSFAALHGISASLYWLKALLVLVLAWRMTAR
jgi:hypothetical protein